MLNKSYPNQNLSESPIEWNTETNGASWKRELVQDTDNNGSPNKPIFMFKRHRSPEPYVYMGVIKNSESDHNREDNRVFFESDVTLEQNNIN